MRDPLLAENPFLQEYTECEKWCYAHAHNYDDPVVDETFAGEHPGWQALEVGVTDEGWLVPVLKTYHQTQESSLGYHDRYGNEDSCAASIFAVGPMDDELKQALLEKFAEQRAPYLLPIPAWLAEAPPRAARFIPDGNFALRGEPGSGTGLDNAWFWSYSPPPADDEPWSLYSPEGEFIRKGEPGEAWWQLYFTNFEEVTGYTVDSDEIELYDWGGTINGYDAETYNLLFSFTYAGENLADNGDGRPETDPRSLALLCGPEIPLVHAAQQHVTPRQPCGLGIGVTDPGELDQLLPIAIGISPATGTIRYITVGALDDEANPYAGLYRDYDHWLYDNHVALCRDLEYNSNLQGDPWNANDAVYDRVLEQTTPGTAFHNFLLAVDDDGWLIPLDLELEFEAQWLIEDLSSAADRLGSNRYLGFQIYSSGNMADDMFSTWEAAPNVIRAPYLPEIPAWLVDNPPIIVRFLPEGGFITFGETGSLNRGDDAPPWVHYDEAGNEIGRVPEDHDWWELTFPDYQLVKQSLGDSDRISADEFSGIIWFSTIDDEGYSQLATYNYRGREVTNPDSSEYAIYFQPYPGDHLAMIRAAQIE